MASKKRSREDSAVPSPEPLVTKDYDDFSEIQLRRLEYVPDVPECLRSPDSVAVARERTTVAASDADTFRRYFKRTFEQPVVRISTSADPSAASKPPALRIGIVFCGRQSPGGHNVVWGLYDLLKEKNPDNELIGFVDGTVGMFEGRYVVLTDDALKPFKNQGGYELLGRSVDQIRSPAQQASALRTCDALNLDGLVMVGGTYTATDAAYLSEYLLVNQTRPGGGKPTQVVAVPCCIDGDLKNAFIETTVGFDTACRVYSSLIGNMATDGASAAKYYYFVRLMGRTTSHIALECALQSHPNMVILGEELKADHVTLADLINQIADMVQTRSKDGKDYGMVVIPEGLIMHIPELVTLIDEMNRLFAMHSDADLVRERLTPWSRAVLNYLPDLISSQLFSERESHGTVQLSQISTETLLSELVSRELSDRRSRGEYSGRFAPIHSFFGYQARCSMPSNFDCNYAYALGRVSALLMQGGFTGYAACLRHLSEPASKWECIGVPLTAMMTIPQTIRHMPKPDFKAVPLSTTSGSFLKYKELQRTWRHVDAYVNPGSIQFEGPAADRAPKTLTLDSQFKRPYLDRVCDLHEQIDRVRDVCRPGVSDAVLDAALVGMQSLSEILTVMKRR